MCHPPPQKEGKKKQTTYLIKKRIDTQASIRFFYERNQPSGQCAAPCSTLSGEAGGEVLSNLFYTSCCFN
jgi:hypothetical protein